MRCPSPPRPLLQPSTRSPSAARTASPASTKNGSAPFKGDLKVQPLELSGALRAKDYSRQELTPAPGDGFDANVKLK
ncbi:hypothetical protein JCM10295v2_005466 [Rhodotorula toruloides]